MSEPVRAIVRSAAINGRKVMSVNADGDPASAWSVEPDSLDPGSVGFDREVERFTVEVEQHVRAMRADSPQMDVAKTLDVAARVGRADASDRPPLIVLIDSLLSTVPPVDFTVDGALAAEPADVVRHVQANGGVPDLSGTSVLFVGAGNTAAPQEAIPPAARSNVVDIWTAIADAGGGACVGELDATPNDIALDDVPEVSPVPVETAAVMAPTRDQPAILRADQVRFEPDTADLSDPEQAGNALAGIVEQLLAQPPMCIEVVGTAATGTPGTGPDATELSEERAHAVAGLLMAAGIPPDALRIRGIGAGPFDGRVVDVDANGNQIPQAAALNRSVRLSLC